jgi:hypothetical protein
MGLQPPNMGVNWFLRTACLGIVGARSKADEEAHEKILPARVSSSPTLDDTTCIFQREVEVMPERHHPVEGRESVLFLGLVEENVSTRSEDTSYFTT